ESPFVFCGDLGLKGEKDEIRFSAGSAWSRSSLGFYRWQRLPPRTGNPRRRAGNEALRVVSRRGHRPSQPEQSEPCLASGAYRLWPARQRAGLSGGAALQQQELQHLSDAVPAGGQAGHGAVPAASEGDLRAQPAAYAEQELWGQCDGGL